MSVKLSSLYMVISNTSALVVVIMLVSFMYVGRSFLYSVRKMFALYTSVKIPKMSSIYLTK